MKTEVVQVSPKMATELLKKNTKNRVLNRAKIAEFASYIENDQWKLTHQGICFSITDKLIDGQHRLHAISKGSKTVPIMIVKGMPDDIMTVIDRGKQRSISDSFQLMEVSNATAISALIAVWEKFKDGGFNDGGNNGVMMSIDERYHFYLDNQTLIEKCHALSLKCYGAIRLFTQSQVAGITAYLVLNKKNSFASVSEFWLQVHNISDQGQSNGTKLLHNTLTRFMTGAEKIKHRYKIALLIKAWNLYKTGGQAKILKYSATDQFPEFM